VLCLKVGIAHYVRDSVDPLFILCIGIRLAMKCQN